MKKQQKQQEQHDISEFEDHIHLWNIPVGNEIALLQKIVDAIHYNQYQCPGKQHPSILITGETRQLTAKAYINSLKTEDIRECPGHYLDNGINSSQLFEDSLITTVHLITDIEHLTTMGQSVIWKYLKEGKCTYYNFVSKDFSKIIHCNGHIILTAKEQNDVYQSILQNIDHCIKTEPYSVDQLRQLAHQQLQFCGITTYRGQTVLDEIVKIDPIDITSIMQLIKTCIVLLEANLSSCLTVKIVQEAKRLCSLTVPADHYDDDIPF